MKTRFIDPWALFIGRASHHQQRHVFGPPVPPVGRVDWRGIEALDVDVGEVSYVESYNTMLADHAWHADWEGALETLQDMRSLQVTPDVTSYFGALCACRRGQRGNEFLFVNCEWITVPLVPLEWTDALWFAEATTQSSQDCRNLFFVYPTYWA